jgi:hypothetical protein
MNIRISTLGSDFNMTIIILALSIPMTSFCPCKLALGYYKSTIFHRESFNSLRMKLFGSAIMASTASAPRVIDQLHNFRPSPHGMDF